MSHYAGEVSGRAYHVADADLWRNTLYVGRPGMGKTNALQGALAAFLEDTSHGCMVVDAAGTLVQNVGAGLAHAIELMEARDPVRAARLRDRVKVLRFASENPTGLRFDLVTRRMIVDPMTGISRREFVKEKVDPIIGVVGAQFEGTDVFSQYGRMARAFTTLLVAAGEPMTNLGMLLDPRNRGYHVEVSVKAMRDPSFKTEKSVYRAWQEIQKLRTEHFWQQSVNSTDNLLSGFFVANESYFGPDSFDIEAHLRSGGILLVDFRHDDERSMLLFHQFLVGRFFAAALNREDGNHMVLVLDELKNAKLSRFTRQMALCRNKQAGVWLAYQDASQLVQEGTDYTSTLLGISHRVVAFSEAEERIAKAIVRRISGARLTAAFLPVVSRTTGTSQTATHGVTEGAQESWSEADEPDEGELVSVQRVDTTRYLADGDVETSTAIVQKANEAPPAPVARRIGGGRSVSRTTSYARSESDQVTVSQERISVDEQLANDLQAFIRDAKQGWTWDIIDGHPPVLVHLRLHPANWEVPVKREAFRRLVARQRSRHHVPDDIPDYRITFPDFTSQREKRTKAAPTTAPAMKVAEAPAQPYAPIATKPVRPRKPRVDATAPEKP